MNTVPAVDRGLGFPGAGFILSSEPPDVGAGKSTPTCMHTVRMQGSKASDQSLYSMWL